MPLSLVRILSRLCLALGVLVAVSSVAMVTVAWSPLPFGDQWFNIVSGKVHDLSWFFALHNEHRLALPRVVFYLDYKLDMERNGVDLAMSLLLLSGTVALLLGMVRRTGLMEGKDRVFAWTGLALGLFSGIQTENLIWGFQVQFFGVCLLAVAAFSVLASASVGLLALAFTVLLSVVASCTLSAGLLVGIVAAGLAAWLGRPRHHVLILVLAESAILACYFIGYRSPVQNSSPLDALGHLDAVTLYFVTEMGGPVATLAFASGGVAVRLAVAAGAVGLALFAVEVFRRCRQQPRDPAVGALTATACFCIAFAGLTSLGRWGFGAHQALAGRYQTPMLLFWFCVIALWARRSPNAALKRTGPLVLAQFGALALIIVNQPRYVQFALRVEALEAAAMPAVLADVADPAALSILSDHPADTVLAEAEPLRQAGTSVFTDGWARWSGRPLHEATALENLPKCRGSFDVVAPVGTGARSGWSAHGRLDGTGRFRGRARIVFAGSEGRVVGYGVAGLSAVAVGAPGARTAVDGDSWRGAFKASSPDDVVAYVLDRMDHAACILLPPRTL